MSNFIEVVDKIKELTGSKLTHAQFAAIFKEAKLNSTLSIERQEKLKEESKLLSNDKKEDILRGIGNIIKTRENELVAPSEFAPLTSYTVFSENSQDTKNTELENQGQSPTQLKPPSIIQPSTLRQDNKQVSKVVPELEVPLNKETINKIDLLPPTDNEVKQYVIPVVADKIASYGKSDINKDSITYENENFTAMLRLEDEKQRITLDRKNTSQDAANALTASKDNKEQEYQIILNNLTRDEFERFKAIFEKASQERNVTNMKERESDGLG